MRFLMITAVLITLMPITGSGWAEGSNLLLDPKLACKKPRKLRGKMAEICRDDSKMLKEIIDGINLGFRECEYQFKNRRWNCTTLRKSMRKILMKDSRESAFVNAITSAGVTYAVTRACTMGNLVECSCDKNHPKRNNVNYKTIARGGSDGGRTQLNSPATLAVPSQGQRREIGLLVTEDDTPQGNIGQSSAVTILNNGRNAITVPPDDTLGKNERRQKNGNKNRNKQQQQGGERVRGQQKQQKKFGDTGNGQNVIFPSAETEIQGVVAGSGLIGADWEWGGCGDNVVFGFRKSKQFLDARYRRRSDIKTLVKIHNNNAGRLAVRKYMRLECKCHGLSGSCTIRTCWQKMPSFREIAVRLKDKFDGASKVIARNDGHSFMPEGPTIKYPAKEDLVYTDESPDFCRANYRTGSLGTMGRECNATSQGVDGCELLCCNRGYDHRIVKEKVNCKCVFKWCCEVSCSTCIEKREISTCR